MKRYTLDFSEELHKRLKVHCAVEGKDMAEVIRKLVEDYLEKTEKKKSK
jgi:predicted DNA-binding protein